jgi:hypothetical protein
LKTIMNDKLPFTLLACLIAAAGTMPAPARAVTTDGIGVTTTATAVSTYMFRGQRLGGLSLQPAAEWSAAEAALGFWSTFPLKDRVPDTSDPELNLYGSYNVRLGERLQLIPGFTYYYFPNAPTADGFYRSTFEPNVAASFSVQGLQLTPKLYYDIILKGATYEVTAAYAVPLTAIGLELNFTGTAGTYKLRDVVHGSNRHKAWGDYWLVGVSIPVQITQRAGVLLGYTYTEGRNAYTKEGLAPRERNALAVGRGVVTLSYSHAF